ncbi:MAG: M24 family metallopeptidase C-terminal domain-containing protein, partial [Pseudomonadota bacterium]|nr:M24 family metallopeptidase C-terminal domain-containing protein [Pseudomonadota bacterium]
QDFDHGTGHGVGSYLSVHEGPQRISKGGMVAMAPGMIVSNEPGYYATGRFGIRIENLQYVRAAKNTGDKHRNMLEFDALTLAPIDRRLIDKSALTEDEKLWLNTYHAEVLGKVKPLVDTRTARWLEKACRPIR